jgi:hypothetical protein
VKPITIRKNQYGWWSYEVREERGFWASGSEPDWATTLKRAYDVLACMRTLGGPKK